MDEKDKKAFVESALKTCQECLRTNPIIILGSGASAPFGLPTMGDLSESVVKHVEITFSGIALEQNWKKFKRQLATVGLEAALDMGFLNGREDINQQIITTAWREVCRPDIFIQSLNVNDPETFSLTILFRRLFQSDHKIVTVVTTNYDRLVEYAAGAGPYLYRTGFNPGYVGRWRSSQGPLQYVRGKLFPRNIEPTVDILKVHGSLDWFRDPKSKAIVSIPIGNEPPPNLDPLIVPPGLTKYQETHQDPFRTILDRVDRALINGNGFLCVGYGFNDEHIHLKLIERVRNHKIPIVVLAKLLTDKTRSYFLNNTNINFIAMEEKENFGTRIYTSAHQNGIDIEGINHWDFPHFVREVI